MPFGEKSAQIPLIGSKITHPAKQWEVAKAVGLTTVSATSGSSEGPGLAIEFGLAVLRALAGEDVYLKVKAGMLL